MYRVLSNKKNIKKDISFPALLRNFNPNHILVLTGKSSYKTSGAKEFLILTYTPKDGMVTDTSINNLLSIKYKIQSLDWVHSVVTLLDIPLLNNSDAPLQERLEKFKTLKDEDVDKDRLHFGVIVNDF